VRTDIRHSYVPSHNELYVGTIRVSRINIILLEINLIRLNINKLIKGFAASGEAALILFVLVRLLCLKKTFSFSVENTVRT
jgi:hypothetical protein